MADCAKLISEAIGDKLDAKEVEAIVQRVEDLRLRRRAEGRIDGMDDDMRKAVAEMANDERIAALKAKQQAARNIIARDRVEGHLAALTAQGISTPRAIAYWLSGTAKGFKLGRDSVSALKLAMARKYTGELLEELRQKPHVIDLMHKDKDFADNVVREMHEIREGGSRGITGDADAQFTAATLAKHSERARVRLNELGANIGHLDGWSPQTHNPTPIRKAGLDGWKAAIRPLLDIERSFGKAATEKDINDALDLIHANILIGNQAGLGKTAERIGPANLANRQGKERALHFANADAQIKYLGDFGRGNVLDAILSNLTRAGETAAVMDRMGANPEAFMTALLTKAQKTVRDSDLKPEEKAKQLAELSPALQSSDSLIARRFRVTVGSDRTVENVGLANTAATIRNVVMTSKLGGVIFASFPDTVTVALAARYQGRGLLSSYAEALGGFFGSVTADKRQRADVAGVGFESLLGDTMGRFSAEDSMPGHMASFAQTFMKLTGLPWWTDRLKSSFATMMAREMAIRSADDFTKLPQRYRFMLETHGVDGNDWAVMRQAAKKMEDGRDYILPDAPRFMDDAQIDVGIKDRLTDARTKYTGPALDRRVERIRKEYRIELENKMRSAFVDETDFAVTTPGDAERASLLRGTRAGDWAGEGLRFMMQFKMFPATMMTKQIPRAFKGMEGQKADYGAITGLMVGMTGVGYLAQSLKQMAQGKEPRNPLDHRVLMDAFMFGGGAGFYGDLLFGEFDKYGRGAIGTIAGPTLGVAEDVLEIWARVREGDDAGAKAFRTLTSNLPFANYIYTKAAVDYLLLHDAQEWINPGSLRRYERTMQRENEQRFFYPPSSNRAQPFTG